MKILYLASARIPTEKAHGLQIMKMCEAFARLGHTVELVVPRRNDALSEDPFDYYGIKRIFAIRVLPALQTVGLGYLGFLLHRLSFAYSVWRYGKNTEANVIYGRDEFALLACGIRAPRVYEAHEGRWNVVVHQAVHQVERVVVITHALKKFFVAHGVSEGKLLVAPDAVAYEQFALAETKEEARARTGLPQDATIVMYAGHLYAWKGVDTLAEAARLLPEALVVFVGGTDRDRQRFTERYKMHKTIRVIPTQPHAEIPHYLRSADVLVLPNTAREPLSSLYTSPMKLFEYLASGRPVVASDLPSLREVVDESCAVFARPDDPKDLARAIRSSIADRTSSDHKVRTAQRIAMQHTWEARARLVLEMVKKS